MIGLSFVPWFEEKWKELEEAWRLLEFFGGNPGMMATGSGEPLLASTAHNRAVAVAVTQYFSIAPTPNQPRLGTADGML